ncbi:inositol monophosphatase [Halobacteriales archaeon QS_4_66_20]|nr:MAG: inositol monophosphatase [Halobacteriales archaeon QS_4_66_20]
MMRGSRLVTTERVVCFASPRSDAAVDMLADAMDAHDATLTVRPVGESLTPDDWIPEKTLGITIGGDGTFLAGVRAFAPRAIPFFGVNTGTLGFLARTDPTDLPTALEEIFRGEASVSDRQRFRVTGPGVEATGINEVTFELPMPEDPVGRKVCQLEVVAGGEYLGRYEGTGLAVAAPTGSTAMALSADGPLQYPPGNRTLQVVGLHTNRLGFRPVVLDADREVRIAADSAVRVSIDGGRPQVDADAGDAFRITGADEPAHLVWTAQDAQFFDALAGKLGWGNQQDRPESPRPTWAADAADDSPPPRAERARRAAREAVCAAGEAVDAAVGRVRQEGAAPLQAVEDARQGSERILASVLDRSFPGVDLRSPDGTVREGDGDRDGGATWLAAPLDGRTNAERGNSHYAVSVALLDGGPVAGAVAAPAFDDVLSARRGTAPVRGSLDDDADDDVPVGPTPRDDLDGAAVLVEGEPPDGLAGTLAGAGEIRRLGSPALALAHVAAGRADACLLTDVDAATVAGGCCLVHAAGGQVTTPDGESFHLRGVDAGDRVSLLASNGPLHEALLATR